VINVNGSPIIDGKPALKTPDFVYGVKDRAAAQAWGEKHGYAIVYFWPRRNRAYAEKLTEQVDAQAKKIERASIALNKAIEELAHDFVEASA